MTTTIRAGVIVAALTGIIGAAALAAPQDYRFEPVAPQVKMGKTVVAVRLVNLKTGQPVSDAIMLPAEAEMAMPGMAPMKTTASPATGSKQPGEYQVEAELAMEGEWTLNLAAKIQGEAETVRGVVKVKAVK